MNNEGTSKISTESGGGNATGNAASKGIQDAQSKGKERKDSNVQSRNAGLQNRDNGSSLGRSSRGKSNTQAPSNYQNSRARDNANNQQAVQNAAQIASKTKNPYAMAIGKGINVADKISGGRASKKLGKKLTMMNRLSGIKGKAAQKAINKPTEDGSGKAEVQGKMNEKKEDQTAEQSNNQEDNPGQEVTEGIIHVAKIVLKIMAIVLSIIPILIIVLLAVVVCLNPVQKVIMKMFINNASQSDVFGETIDEMDDEASEDDLTYINLSRDFKIYLKQNNNFIDDSQSISNSFSAKSSADIDLSFLNQYYKLDCKGKECEKKPSYRFYRKLYDIYFLYKYKYGVKINLGLLAATLDFNTEDPEITFDRNVQDYDADAVRQNDYNNDNITDLDWEYDYKNIDGYKYLNSEDFRYDMQILAKNMVTKKITYKCNDDSSSGSVDDSLKVITDNKSNGDGWDSVTKVTYPNGTKRTFRNYKQCVGTYSTKNYWGGDICSDGCGPTSVAIILSGYGYDYGPDKVVNRLHKLNITYTNNDNLVNALKSLNIKVKKGIANGSEAVKAIRNNFKEGRPVMIGLSNHWITYLGENSKGLILSDPGDSYASNDKYGKTLEDVINNSDVQTYILIQSDGKSSSSDSSSSKKSKSTKTSYGRNEVIDNDDGTKTMYDIETGNYESKLECSGGTLDTDSISEEYELNMDKYDEFLLEYLEHKYYLEGEKVDSNSTNGGNNVSGNGQLNMEQANKNLCTGSVTPGEGQSSEPCPNKAILYWKQYLKQSDFVFPKDEKTGLPLGAWPKNYAKYPTQLSGYKTYHNYYIWPITPINNTYTFVYDHTSMDIMAKFGTPVYSPVDGTLVYSEWGHTGNKGSDETAYSVTIKPDHVVNYGGTAINEIFFTHMSGIRYRCGWGCNRKVKAGELLGFSGNAAGTSSSVGWAPHLHLTYYNSSSYEGTALHTHAVESFYNLKSNQKRKVGE